VKPLWIQAVLLLLPILLTLCFRWAALQREETEQKRVWAVNRRWGRFILIGTVIGWWVTWGSGGRSALISAVASKWPNASPDETLLFWVPPTVSLGLYLFLCNTVDQRILRLKWTLTDALRRAWWKLVSFVIPLLLVAAGFDALMEKKVRGIVWLMIAGLISKVGTVFLRWAEGLKFNALRTGELRNRALTLASRMGITLGKVFIVPAGKGHLTNAYGMSNAIALTDNLGKYLTKFQMEFVIAHELAHVKLKHGRKLLLLIITIYSGIALLLFNLPRRIVPFHPFIQTIAMLGPLLAFYYCSRRFEFSADGEAVAFTGHPETGVRALLGLYEAGDLAVATDRFTQLFMTHPSFLQRVRAIATKGRLPIDRLPEIMSGKLRSR
jgi:Zn-dependent protease with chaperone function